MDKWVNEGVKVWTNKWRNKRIASKRVSGYMNK